MNLRRWVTHNWHHKLVSLILGLVVWAAQTNAENPIETLERNSVPLIADAGSEFRAVPEQDHVKVTFRGPRRDLAHIPDAAGGLVARLDLKDPTKEGPQRGFVQVPGPPARVQRSAEPVFVVCNLVRLDEKTVHVRVDLRGPAIEGINFDNVVCVPQEVKVRGPKDSVDAVHHVRTVVRRIELVNNPLVEARVRAMDASDAGVEPSELTLDPPSVVISLPSEKKKGVRVRVPRVGQPAPGCTVSAVEVDPSTVEVRGQPEALDSLEEILTEDLDLAGRAQSFEISRSLRPPPRVSPLNVSSVTVRVTLRSGGGGGRQ